MIQIRSWNFPQARCAWGGVGGVRLGFLAGTGDSTRVPRPPAPPRVTAGWWAVRACAFERGGPSLRRVCVDDSAPGQHGCLLAAPVAREGACAQVSGFPGIVRGSLRRAAAGTWAAARRQRAGRGRVPRVPGSALPPRDLAARGVRPPVRQPGRRAVSAGWCVPGPRAPAPSLPSPLARSQTQIKHFLPLSSYPAGRAARALPLPAPSLPLAVSQSLRSLRRPGGM